MSVLKSKRTESKAEYVNVANAIYIETINFLTRISARYSRLIAEPVAKLAGEVMLRFLICRQSPRWFSNQLVRPNRGLCPLFFCKKSKGGSDGPAYHKGRA